MLLLAINAYPGDIFYTPCRFTGIEKWMFTHLAALRESKNGCLHALPLYGGLKNGRAAQNVSIPKTDMEISEQDREALPLACS